MLELLWSIAGFIVAISVLVCFHEYGHYWMARRMGVRVLRFSLGWGKPFYSFRARDGVEWSIAPYPIGGYVKMLDEREGPVPTHQRHLAFNNQRPSKRIAILAAGPIFNFLLAILLYWVVAVLGVQGMKSLIAEPPAQTAAAQAGLRSGERIVAVDGHETPTWTALQTELIDATIGREQLSLRVAQASGAERQVILDLGRVRVDPQYLFDDLGLRPFEPKIEPVLAEVLPETAAADAGFRAGDRILSRDGRPVESWADWASWVAANPGKIADVEIERGGTRQELRLIVGRTPDNADRGWFGAKVQTSGDLWQDLRAEQRLGAFEAMPVAVSQTWQMSQLILRMLGRMLTGEVSVKNVSGPIQIAQVAGDSAQIGLVPFLHFMAVVSVSLGVLNFLPVPLLDGGHLVMYVAEWIRGRPLSERIQLMSQYIGIAVIGAMMVLAFFNDIMRLIY